MNKWSLICSNFFKDYKSPPFHSVIRIHLISLSYHILVILPSHFSTMEQMLMLMLGWCSTWTQLVMFSWKGNVTFSLPKGSWTIIWYVVQLLLCLRTDKRVDLSRCVNEFIIFISRYFVLRFTCLFFYTNLFILPIWWNKAEYIMFKVDT